ncbi:MAG: SUMF1/EgtB/PvdO family nonheme iron enzyme [Anaerolineae bacterium]
MSALPTGTVTFLFTDIAGSTALWERDRDAMQAALALHDALLRAAIESRNGHVFKTVGDAFCAAFARAQDALEAALACQRALAAADWTMLGTSGPLRARMGLHTGEAAERGGDYFGPPVNRVARLEAAGHGGQVLLSDATYNLVRDRLPDGCALRDWGEHRLKDLRHTEHIFQLKGPGVPDVATPPSTAEALHPRERVRVVEADAIRTLGAPARDLGGIWTNLEAALRSDVADAITLTTADAAELARHKPADWREWRLGRVAEWSHPRYRLDGRFVGLTLLLDQGEESTSGRWAAKEERHDDLGALMAGIDDPAIVILGPPGGGKSTLLRRLELDTAIAGLRGEADGDRVTFFIALNTYAPPRPGDPPPPPGEWLSAQWSARNPGLPPLDDLLAEGRVTLLLDALNEMPSVRERDFRDRVQQWKAWLQQLVAAYHGNRVVFSCRALDYSQPLSTPDLRVPQVRIEPLSDAQVRDFLALYSPGRWREVWAALAGSSQLEVLRSPYFLALLVEQVDATGEMPAGRAALFTGFVRQALRREMERGNALFEPGELLDSQDVRRLAAWQWHDPYDLPDRGLLVPKLSTLAHAMQAERDAGGESQVRIDYDRALDLLDTACDEAILAAGESLAVLDEDEAAGEVMYVHQLVQEYFAARHLAIAPDPELVRVEWRAARIRPSVTEVIDALDAADALPPLPGTGWEETTILAAAMAHDPVAFLRDVLTTNLALAGRAAAQPELRARLPQPLLDDLRWALVHRSRDVEADVRERIACGLAAGDLGDPRFERRQGPHGPYLMPPLVATPGGVYSIGADDAIAWSLSGNSGSSTAHVPRNEVAVAAFAIGRYPVTNAEWACFMASRGYEDERWWDTPDGRRWRRGEMANEGSKANSRTWRRQFKEDPALFEQVEQDGRFPSAEVLERWRRWLLLDDAAFEAALAEQWPAARETEPRFWRDGLYNRPTQPVVGVSWYEARAYGAWLSAQAGLGVRLRRWCWEAAAGGRAGAGLRGGGRGSAAGKHATVKATTRLACSRAGRFAPGRGRGPGGQRPRVDDEPVQRHRGRRQGAADAAINTRPATGRGDDA